MAYTKKCKLNRCDFISSLPDDILLNILSKLTIKEQARTSILSSRWTQISHMWTLNSCLNIDAEDFVQKDADRPIRILKFIDTVDRILTMHRGQVIEQLKIIFPVDPGVKRGDKLKDSWINIAKQKQVKALHLDCKVKHSMSLSVRKFPCDFTAFSSLITLHIGNAFLSDNFMDGILSNSPNLLELSIINCSRFFLHLNISSPDLKLKHLELIGSYIFSLEISAPNLVSFNFSTCERTTWPFTICFKNIPLLTQMSCSLWSILHARRDFYVFLPQLVTLTLTISKNSEVGDIGNFPMLANLKEMHVRLLSDDDKAGLRRWLLELFKASPYVRRLSFELGTHTPKHYFIENFPDQEFLEELEIYNFKGFGYEVKLMTCIAKSCKSLQKIIIHLDSCKRKVEQDRVELVVKKSAAQKELEIVFKAVNNF